MGEAVYAIDDFPDNDLLWRIEWIGGVSYNPSVPSDPFIDVFLAQMPVGETNPLSARSRSLQTKGTVRIGVGLLPYISIASVWQQRRPIVTELSACRHRLLIDTSSCRTIALADLATAIPRSSYLFGVSWPNVRRTLLVAVERDGDPFGVLIPTAEIIRFYYATSTRLAQALFWGEYRETFNATRSGMVEEGAVRVHLRRWLEDQDAWTLARLMPAWTKADESVSDREKLAPDRFQANEEPRRGHEPLRIELMAERFEYLRDKRLVKEEKIVQRYRFLPANADGTQMLTGLGTGQGTWGTSNLQLTKLTTVQTPAATPAKRREVPVLPASLETFVHAIELLREQRQPCEVAFVGEGDTSLGAHALANFPSHDPTKGKRIAWGWIRKHNRPRHVAIAEIRLENRVAYVLEIERTKQEHATLILARNDFGKVSPSEWQAFLLQCAVRRGWPSEDEVAGYRRKTTTHQKLISVSVFESRIWRKVVKLLGNGTGS